MTTIIKPAVQKFKLGDAWVTTIHDGEQYQEALKPPFALDKSEEELATIGAANRLPSDTFLATFTLTLIETGGEVVLVDTGFGAAGRDSGKGKLRALLAAAGYAPNDVTTVAISHVHPDHILGLYEGDALAFPNARHVIGRVEYDGWKSGEKIPPQRAQNREMFEKLIVPLAPKLTFLEDGDALAPGLVAEAAYGHSVGHMMFRLESQSKQLLVWSDVTNHYVYSLQYPTSPVGYDDDKDEAIKTRIRVLDMAASDDLLVAGFHMPFPAVGYVEKHADAFAWVPATYQLWPKEAG